MRNQKAFTLLEIILVVALIGMVLFAIYPYIKSINQAWEYGDRKTEMLQHARVSMDKMIKTLRGAKRITQIDAAEEPAGQYITLLTQNNTPITFFHNVETIGGRYIAPEGNVKNSDLIMQQENGGVITNNVLARSVKEITFTYLNDRMEPVTTPSEARAIKIDMELMDPEGKLESTTSLSSMVVVRAPTGSDSWAITAGGAGDDQIFSVEQTLDKGYVMAGETSSFGVRDFDAYLIKINYEREHQFSRTFGDRSHDRARSVEQTVDVDGNPTGYILAGYGKSDTFTYWRYDAYVVRTDMFGDVTPHEGPGGWVKFFGGENSDWFSVISPRQQTFDINGNPTGYIFAGFTMSFNTNPEVDYSFYVVKTNPEGNTKGTWNKDTKQWEGNEADKWQRTYGGDKNELAYCVIQTLDEENGNPDGYIIVGRSTSFNERGEEDAYVVRTDMLGNVIPESKPGRWQESYGDSGSDTARSIQQVFDENGNPDGYIITGETASYSIGGDFDVYLLRIDNSGKELWHNTFGGTGDDFGRSIEKTSDEGYIIAGWTSSFGGGDNVYLIKIDEDGNPQWPSVFGGELNDGGYYAQEVFDKNGKLNGYIVAGYTYSFGAGNQDAYLIKTDLNGNCPEASDPTPIIEEPTPG